MEGKKHDQGKLRFDLIDPWFLKEMAEVMTHGAEKYAPNNWQQVEDFEARYTAALERHWNDYRCGHTIDGDSDCQLLAQVAVNAMFLAWKLRRKYLEPVKYPDVPRPADNDITRTSKSLRCCNECGKAYSAGQNTYGHCPECGRPLTLPDAGRAYERA